MQELSEVIVIQFDIFLRVPTFSGFFRLRKIIGQLSRMETCMGRWKSSFNIHLSQKGVTGAIIFINSPEIFFPNRSIKSKVSLDFWELWNFLLFASKQPPFVLLMTECSVSFISNKANRENTMCCVEQSFDGKKCKQDGQQNEDHNNLHPNG